MVLDDTPRSQRSQRQRIFSRCFSFVPLTSKIAHFREDFHLVIVRKSKKAKGRMKKLRQTSFLASVKKCDVLIAIFVTIINRAVQVQYIGNTKGSIHR